MPQLIRILEKAGLVWLAAAIVAVSALAQPTPRPMSRVLGSADLALAGALGPDGYYYDYIFLTGASASVDPADDTVTRTWFIDADDDIVSVDFSGAGTISFAMESWTGPALPTKYKQSTTYYIKGAAAITVVGSDATTRLRIFTVGRGTATNQGLFRTDVTYDGVADLQSVAIASVGPGRFGELDAQNARFAGSLGVVGIVAPEITFTGAVTVHDIEATGLGVPGLRLGSAADVRICGGDLFQPNGKSISVSGFAELKMVEGTTSHDVRLAACPLGGVLAAKAAVVVTPIELTFVAGQSGVQRVSMFGSPAPSCGIAGGTFPSWMHLDGSTGRITGTPPDTAGSPYTFTIRVSNGGGLYTDANVTLTVTPAAIVAPVFESYPDSAVVNLGGTHTFSPKVNGTAPISYQWSRNGAVIEGATSSTLHLADIGVAEAGFYSVVATNSAGSDHAWADIGIVSSTKVGGAAVEIGSDITHPNGKRYDQVLLQGMQATIQSQDGDVTRLSFIDLNDDIVQLEFSGQGTLSLVLEEASGPATALNYAQPVTYMKGHAGIIITGYNETTNLSITSVGRLTAFDPTGKWDIRKPVSDANDPAANGNPIFKADVRYDGIADLAYVVLIHGGGKFGGIRAAGASFFAQRGYTGIYAPSVEFHGPVFVGDIDAFDSAQPVLVLGSAADVRITGGALAQTNGAPVQVSGLTRLRFVDGTNSHGVLLRARSNQARLEDRGSDVTNEIVVTP